MLSEKKGKTNISVSLFKKKTFLFQNGVSSFVTNILIYQKIKCNILHPNFIYIFFPRSRSHGASAG